MLVSGHGRKGTFEPSVETGGLVEKIATDGSKSVVEHLADAGTWTESLRQHGEHELYLHSAFDNLRAARSSNNTVVGTRDTAFRNSFLQDADDRLNELAQLLGHGSAENIGGHRVRKGLAIAATAEPAPNRTTARAPQAGPGVKTL